MTHLNVLIRLSFCIVNAIFCQIFNLKVSSSTFYMASFKFIYYIFFLN
jgi:hypothetical protein